MRLLRHSTGERFAVSASDVIGSGGEARVFGPPDEPSLAAKLYHQPSEARLGKLRAMLANPPEDPMGGQAHIAIAWPVDLLSAAHADRGFRGFLMPRVSGMRPIFQVYNPSVRRAGGPPIDYRFLVRAGRNLAAAVRAIHARGYVIGDVNESNILVSERALVTLVDTDSFQVMDEVAGLTYRCPVGKPEYTPPELQGRRFSQLDRSPEHDRFGLAVLLFQLLMEGTHPFAGIYSGAGDPPAVESRIAKGHFTYGGAAAPYRPAPVAPTIDLLDPGLRLLFLRCFEDGHTRPTTRPDAATWQAALTEAERALAPCSDNPMHLYGSHLAGCPWCPRAELLGGRDPFPIPSTEQERPMRRVPAASLLAPNPSVGRSTGGSRQATVTPPPPSYLLPAAGVTPTANWQMNAPLSASVNGGGTGAPLVPTLLTVKLARNGWAWGALFWALLAIAAVPLGMPGLNWSMTLLALGCGAAGWHAGLKLGGLSRWMGSAAALCALVSSLVKPPGAAQLSAAPLLSAGGGGVRSLAFSPDGRKLASGTSRMEDLSLTAGEVNVWDVASRRLDLTPERSSGDIVSVSFAPDGRSVAAASDTPFGTGEAVVADVAVNGSYRTIFKERHHIRQVAYSPDGTTIATAGAEPLVRVWDAHTLTERYSLDLPTEAGTLGYSADGRLLAIGCRSSQGLVTPGHVSVWSIASGHRLWLHPAHGNGVQTVAFQPHGRLLASAGNDGAICLWDAETGRLVRRQTAATYGIQALAYTGDGSVLATAESQQTDTETTNSIVLREGSTGRFIRSIPQGSDVVQALASSPTGRMLASGSRSGAIRLWNAETH